MLMLLVAALASAHSPSTTALSLCKPLLARKAGGDLSTISIDSSFGSSKGTTVRGRLTAFQGMGQPAPGSASAHHLIRADFSYFCTVRNGKVRSSTVRPVT